MAFYNTVQQFFAPGLILVVFDQEFWPDYGNGFHFSVITNFLL